MAGARGRGAHVNYSFSSYNRMPYFAKPSITSEEFQKLNRRRGEGPILELRLLVRGRNAGIIIGKSGSNIKRIQREFKINMLLTDSQSPERILSMSGQLGSVCAAILDLIPTIDNNPPSDVKDDVDVRVLMHQSQTGCVVGKKGIGLKQLYQGFKARVKVYVESCPLSTDRIVQINGRPVDIVNCLTAIVDMVIMVPPIGMIVPYNPDNFVEIKALDYGGFTNYNVSVPFQGGFIHSVDPDAFRPNSLDREGRSFGQVAASSGIGEDHQAGDWVPGNRFQPMQGHGPCTVGHQRNPTYESFSPAGPSEVQAPTGDVCPDEGHRRMTTGDDDQTTVEGQSTTRKIPFDRCPGPGFYPVDGRTVRVSVPKPLQSVIMGRRGTALKEIRVKSRCRILIEVPPAGAPERYLTLTGTPEQLQKAQYLLQMRYLDGKIRYTEDPQAYVNRGNKKKRHAETPWMTEEIMKMRYARRRLERVWKAQKTDESKKAFKDYCLEMSRVIRRVRDAYYEAHGGVEKKRKARKKKTNKGVARNDKANADEGKQDDTKRDEGTRDETDKHEGTRDDDNNLESEDEEIELDEYGSDNGDVISIASDESEIGDDDQQQQQQLDGYDKGDDPNVTCGETQ